MSATTPLSQCSLFDVLFCPCMLLSWGTEQPEAFEHMHFMVLTGYLAATLW